jgi:hypothetical protein
MNNFKSFAAWLVLVLLTAGGTVLGMQVLNKSLDMQQKVAKFGK